MVVVEREFPRNRIEAGRAGVVIPVAIEHLERVSDVAVGGGEYEERRDGVGQLGVSQGIFLRHSDHLLDGGRLGAGGQDFDLERLAVDVHCAAVILVICPVSDVVGANMCVVNRLEVLESAWAPNIFEDGRVKG